MGRHHASLPPITSSERAGVFWTAYVAGRRFRVIREGARLIHGQFGEGGGAVDLRVGTVIEFRDWLSDADGDITPIWATIDGQQIAGIIGNNPPTCPWAAFSPSCPISYMPRAEAGLDNLPWPEQAFAPDPTFLQPVDDSGEPQAWL